MLMGSLELPRLCSSWSSFSGCVAKTLVGRCNGGRLHPFTRVTMSKSNPYPAGACYKWRHNESAQIILRCVRWYCSYPLSYRQVAEMVNERGIDVNYTTVCALGTRVWKRNRQALPQRAIAVAVDCGRPGQQRSRDATAAIRFFRKALNAVHTQEPRGINEG